MRLLSRHDIEALLSPDACLAAMEDAMIALAQGRAAQPSRTVLPLHQDRDSVLFMPAILDRPPILGTKVVTIYPHNRAHGLASHHGGLLVFEAEHGRPIALLEGSSLTEIRTAAVTALATRLLARPEASVHALLGTGAQAQSHLEALQRVRAFEEVRVWSPREASRQAFLEGSDLGERVRLIATTTAEEAVRGADVVTTVTSAQQPILHRDWIAPGTHLNAVGASTENSREIDAETVAASTLVVDCRRAAFEEAGEILIPISKGQLDETHIRAELGEVADGTHPGRTTTQEITLFKSVGLAIQDLAAAAVVIREAERLSLGQLVDWS